MAVSHFPLLKQFSPNNPNEVVVSSADSLVRILKGVDIISKLRGSLPIIDRGSRVFASFTADGKHIISATDDSNVYIWNHFNSRRITNKPKNIWSCESFLSQNAESPVSSKHHSVEHEALQRSNQTLFRLDWRTEYEFLKNVCEGVLSGSHMWGLVIVTAGKDGRIRTYHNYGLPIRYPTRKSLKSHFLFLILRIIVEIIVVL
ncbi:WD repeat-containing protein 44 [Bienertia sinuspersici]